VPKHTPEAKQATKKAKKGGKMPAFLKKKKKGDKKKLPAFLQKKKKKAKKK